MFLDENTWRKSTLILKFQVANSFSSSIAADNSCPLSAEFVGHFKRLLENEKYFR